MLEANVKRMLELAKMPEAREKGGGSQRLQQGRIGNHHSPRVVPSGINTTLNDTCVSALHVKLDVGDIHERCGITLARDEANLSFCRVRSANSSGVSSNVRMSISRIGPWSGNLCSSKR